MRLEIKVDYTPHDTTPEVEDLIASVVAEETRVMVARVMDRLEDLGVRDVGISGYSDSDD